VGHKPGGSFLYRFEGVNISAQIWVPGGRAEFEMRAYICSIKDAKAINVPIVKSENSFL